MKHFQKTSFLAVMTLSLIPMMAQATAITFTGSGTNPDGGHALTASVTFDTSGTDHLIVTLTNLSLVDVDRPSDVLTAVFFSVAGNPILGRISAEIASGSQVLVGGTGVDVTPADGVVGGEWAYVAGKGISSTGLGIFGPPDLFPGSNLQGPDGPDGVQYGITSGGDDLLTGNGGLTDEHFIKNSVVFTLSGLPGGFDPSASISNVSFQYGTDLSEPNIPATPEPSTIILLGVSLLGLFGIGRRKVKR